MNIYRKCSRSKRHRILFKDTQIFFIRILGDSFFFCFSSIYLFCTIMTFLLVQIFLMMPPTVSKYQESKIEKQMSCIFKLRYCAISRVNVRRIINVVRFQAISYSKQQSIMITGTQKCNFIIEEHKKLLRSSHFKVFK